MSVSLIPGQQLATAPPWVRSCELKRREGQASALRGQAHHSHYELGPESRGSQDRLVRSQAAREGHPGVLRERARAERAQGRGGPGREKGEGSVPGPASPDCVLKEPRS